MDIELINNSWEQTEVYLISEISNKLDGLNTNIVVEPPVNNITIEPSVNNIQVDINKIERTTNIYVRNEIVSSTSNVNYIPSSSVTIHYGAISKSTKQREGISILGINEPFYIKDCRLVSKSGSDLSNYLPLIFNYEPPGTSLILMGIVGYSITKNNSPHLTYEVYDKSTGVRKIFNSGTGLWWKWNKEIKIMI